MIKKIEIWANVLFRNAKWEDANGNARIEPEEIKPADRLTATEVKKVNADINKTYIPLIRSLDTNNDGLSYDEIKQGLFPKQDIPAIDTDKVIDSLVAKGAYQEPGCPVQIFNADGVPKEIIEGYFDAKGIAGGDVAAKRVELKNGTIGFTPFITKNVQSVVLVPGKHLKFGSPAGRERLKMILEHEFTHVRQGNNGRMDEHFSVKNFAVNDAAVSRDQIDFIGQLAYDPLQEMEAYKECVKARIAANDAEGLKKMVFRLNCEIAKKNMAREALVKYGSKKTLELLDQFAEEILPAAEVKDLNDQSVKIAETKPEYMPKVIIYPDFTEARLNDVYTKEDVD